MVKSFKLPLQVSNKSEVLLLGKIHCDYIKTLNDVNVINASNPHLMGPLCAIYFPKVKGNAIFHITTTMLQLLQS